MPCDDSVLLFTPSPSTAVKYCCTLELKKQVTKVPEKQACALAIRVTPHGHNMESLLICDSRRLYDYV